MKGLSCHVACGILPEHGWNLCPLHWEVDSQPLDYQGCLEFCIFIRSFWKMQREGVEELLSLFLSCSACKRTGTSSLKLSLMIFAHRGELYSFVHLINPFYSCHSSRHTAPWAWPMPRMTMYCRVNNNWLISLKTRLWALRSRIMSFILYYPQHLASLLSHSRFSKQQSVGLLMRFLQGSSPRRICLHSTRQSKCRKNLKTLECAGKMFSTELCWINLSMSVFIHSPQAPTVVASY